jgi:dinuclear metal center YbgI/SA1388 family protein
MTVTLGELIKDFETLWPTQYAEQWDSVGLASGNLGQSVSRVLLSVDVTQEVLREAAGFDLILSHHPVMLKGVLSIAEQSAKGSVLTSAVRQNIALFAAHTNADSPAGGVSDTLASLLGLRDAGPLIPSEWASVGSGRVGNLTEPSTLLELSRQLAGILPPTATGIRVSGDHDALITRVALCGGAGDAFIDAAFDTGAQVYITSDLRHHRVQEARERALAENRSMAFIDVSHWASEWLWLQVAASQLSKLHPTIDFQVCDLRTDPWDFVITQ